MKRGVGVVVCEVVTVALLLVCVFGIGVAVI